MKSTLRWIKESSDVKVLVIGEAILDRYLHGGVTRMCREGPVPVIDLRDRLDSAGGAANSAVNVRAMGGRATLLSVVGDDAEGAALAACLRASDVPDDHLLRHPGRSTLAKHRLLADGHLMVRFDNGTTDGVEGALEDELIGRLTTLFERHDAVIVSDYGYGVLTPKVIDCLAHLQSRSPRFVLVDTKDFSRYRHVGVTAAKPNYEEVRALLGPDRFTAAEDRVQVVTASGDELLDEVNATLVAVTLDVDGAVFLERDKAPYRTYARPARNLQATGAGDTFAAALTLSLAAGAPTHAAAEIASSAAAVVVAREGTTVCSLADLERMTLGQEKYVADEHELERLGEHYRGQGQTTVFTNGCFDILHSGHVAYLNAAKALGDKLIVGVNSDDSVRRLKGAHRPINALDDRVQLLAAMSCVDHVVVFDGDTAAEVIALLKPDLFVKGGDYTLDMLPEAPLVERLGGRVQILPYVEDRSTSAIVERIRANPPIGSTSSASSSRR
ncbi:MAG: D-glycero-beta-D-manno-heptose 1-phosphate adenylyltransferase [Actinomycetota bacterium]|nr:D-glycero-beta-D-manno-heptose 1-phosphate adenylyltransferase [Actinomycetota bacterium]